MARRKTDQNGARVISTIRNRIIHWKYPPNHPLGEEGLSKEFGVSRSPIREALRILESEGLVSHIPNRGFFVRQFKSGEVEELYIVRLALELYSVEFLAVHTETHEAVQTLGAPWREILSSKTPLGSKRMAEVDEDFHEGLTRLTGNGMLLAQLQSINRRLYVFREMDFAIVMENNTLDESCSGHLAVVESIVKGDPVAARESIRTNLVTGLGNVDKAMGRILIKTFNA